MRATTQSVAAVALPAFLKGCAHQVAHVGRVSMSATPQSLAGVALLAFLRSCAGQLAYAVTAPTCGRRRTFSSLDGAA